MNAPRSILDSYTGTATISTGDAKRAEYRRTSDLFNVAEYPDMVFKSTKMNFAGDKVQSVDGMLTLLGVTKPVTLLRRRSTAAPTR